MNRVEDLKGKKIGVSRIGRCVSSLVISFHCFMLLTITGEWY